MALFSLPPATSQNDLNLNIFFSPNAETKISLRNNRTFLPEWFTQSGVQITWPHKDTDWNYILQDVTNFYIRLTFEIATRETLLIVTPYKEEVEKLLKEQLPLRATKHILYAECPTDDTWARDHGFLSVATRDGIELLDFQFNGWGGKYKSSLDNAINKQIRPVLQGKYVDCLDFVLEGGSVETDGNGTLLTTERCLLNPNRNPLLQREDIESLLSERLGIKHFLWLKHGFLAGDDTDSHIDTLARLCPNQTIAYVKCDDRNDEHYADLKIMEEELQMFRTPDNQPYHLVSLPLPLPIYEEGERLPATYANYLVMNTTVLCPTYSQPKTDEIALRTLRQIFPDHDVVGIDCRTLIRQHGSLHCATMQYPKGVLPQP